MKILMLTHRFPFPADKGDRIRAYHWLRALTSRFDVDVLSPAQDEIPAAYLREVGMLAKQVTVVRQPRWTLWPRVGKAFVTGRSLTEAVLGSRPFVQAIQDRLDRGKYDACLAVCSSMGAAVLQTRWQGSLIVDLVDVDSAKWQLYARRSRRFERWIYNRESRRVRDLETRLAERAALTTAVSGRECDLLRRIAPQARTATIPNGVDTTYFAPRTPSGPIRRLVFVGQMDYVPNIDAVTWFSRCVWPEIARRYPDLQWEIVGRNPAPAVQALSRGRNVTVTGTVPDVRPYLESAIAVVPMRIACGVQNKILEAMSAGRPVISSYSAACGLAVQPQEELLVARNAREWIAAIHLLLSDPTLAHGLGIRARQAMLDRFAWDQIWPHMCQVVEDAAAMGGDTPAAVSPVPGYLLN